MKLFYAMLLIFWIWSVSAVEILMGSGSTVFPSAGREYQFSYHTGNDDFHLYGSDVWAVRFDFSSVYPAMETCEFAVSSALLYLPQTADSVRVEVFTEIAGSPGSSLTWKKVAVTSNYLEVPFDNPVQGEVLWLVVTYPTNFANRYVSASSGDGSHSYYWNTNVANPVFQSLAVAGFEAELLFGVGGDFVLSGVDLELVQYELNGVLEPRETVGHSFKIYNHSNTTVTDATLGVNIYSPDSDYSWFDEITISDPILPNSFYEFTSQSAEYADHLFTMPPRPMQLKARAELESGMQNDPQGNNLILLHRFCFEEEYPVFLVENFLRADSSSQISHTQDQSVFQDFHTLNYFPILSDSLGNVPAQIRFNWYDFNSLPRTSVNGDRRLNGFSPDYAGSFIADCQSVQNLRTFISSSMCRLSYNQNTDLLTASLTLENGATMLYNSATEYNLISHLTLHIGMFKRINFDGADRYVVSRWIAHNSAIDGSLGAGESYSAEYVIPLNYITLDELNQYYRLYYWLQLENGGKIFYSNWIGFDSIVANQDDVQPVPEILVSTNPLSLGGTLGLKTGSGQDILNLQVFNIRGQKIIECQEASPEINLSHEQFPVPGLYIIKASFRTTDGKIQTTTKKITVLR